MARSNWDQKDYKRLTKVLRTLPPNIDKIVIGLCTLPLEIVYQILDSLPIDITLDLASYHQDKAPAQAPYFNNCLVTYLPFREIFPDLEAVRSIIWIWSFRQCLQLLRGRDRREGHDNTGNEFWEDQSQMAYEIGRTIDRIERFSYQWLQYPSYFSPYFDLVKAITDSVQHLLKSCTRKIETLGRKPYTFEMFSLKTYYYSPELENREPEKPWADLMESARRFNTLRSDQLNRIADLFDIHRSMLKKSSDPAIDARPNIDHIVSQLRGNAQRVLKADPIDCFRQSKQDFADHVFPVVPIDSCLRLFVRTLERYPLGAVQRKGQETERVYPPPIVAAIEHAQKSLAYVRTGHDPLETNLGPKLLRTKYTPYSASWVESKSYSEKAMFTSPWYPHLQKMILDDRFLQDITFKPEKEKKRKPRNPYFDQFLGPRMYELYPEEEFEWLKAFLTACEFMEKLEA